MEYTHGFTFAILGKFWSPTTWGRTINDWHPYSGMWKTKSTAKKAAEELASRGYQVSSVFEIEVPLG